MADITRLHVYGPMPPGFQERLKEAKRRSGFEGGVIFADIDPSRWHRLICYEVKPPLLIDYALVTRNTTDDGLVQAVQWALGMCDDDRASTLAKQFERVLGKDVTELDPEVIGVGVE